MNYLVLTSLFVAFFGYVVGIILHNTTGKEVEDGKLCLLIFKEFIVLAFILMVFYTFNIKIISMYAAAILAGLFIPGMRYFYFGFIAPFSVLLNFNFSLISLIFIYGIPEGSLISKNRKKIQKNILFNFSIFIIGIFISFFLKENIGFLVPTMAFMLFGSFLSELEKLFWEEKIFKR